MRSIDGDPAMFGKPQTPQREPTSLSIDARLIAEAKSLDIDISRIAEDGIAKAVADEKARLWKIENKEAIEGWNDYIEKNGLPLAKYRLF
jgi:antitoxin CcdA